MDIDHRLCWGGPVWVLTYGMDMSSKGYTSTRDQNTMHRTRVSYRLIRPHEKGDFASNSVFTTMAGQRSGYGKRPHPQSDYDNGANKRRNHGDDREQFVIDLEDSMYRYLCPAQKIGSVIGRGGEIVKQLRVETKSKIRIGETVLACEERVVTIYSPSDETNPVEDSGSYVSPAQDALFKVHDRVVAEDLHGGQIVQTVRSEIGAQIRILKDDHLPTCALSSDELHLLTSAVPGLYPAGGSLIGPTAGAPIGLMGDIKVTPVTGRGPCTQHQGMRHLQRNFQFDWFVLQQTFEENLPRIVAEDDEMVQISGDLDVAKDALVHVLTRLRANLFDREGTLFAFLPVLPYLPVSTDGSDGLNYDSRDGKRHGRGHSYSSGYGGSSDLAPGDIYRSYDGSQLGSSSAYGAYGSYSLGTV
ncbi:hypothetical protein VNO77_19402 [Canavalia gladiata]|uniref:K Homology domain-containing protein n=1 Tax=Canavalia gladiata TaxID=3824 RepID=A0AAN9LNA5_CANGL